MQTQIPKLLLNTQQTKHERHAGIWEYPSDADTYWSQRFLGDLRGYPSWQSNVKERAKTKGAKGNLYKYWKRNGDINGNKPLMM